MATKLAGWKGKCFVKTGPLETCILHFNDIFRALPCFIFLGVITHIKKKENHSLVFCSTDLIISLIKSWQTGGHGCVSGICHRTSAGG